jgi:hypothetical protein
MAKTIKRTTFRPTPGINPLKMQATSANNHHLYAKLPIINFTLEALKKNE